MVTPPAASTVVVLATTPFPANPMETKTGLSRPGTFTLRTRMECGDDLTRTYVPPKS